MRPQHSYFNFVSRFVDAVAHEALNQRFRDSKQAQRLLTSARSRPAPLRQVRQAA